MQTLLSRVPDFAEPNFKSIRDHKYFKTDDDFKSDDVGSLITKQEFMQTYNKLFDENGLLMLDKAVVED